MMALYDPVVTMLISILYWIAFYQGPPTWTDFFAKLPQAKPYQKKLRRLEIAIAWEAALVGWLWVSESAPLWLRVATLVPLTVTIFLRWRLILQRPTASSS